MLKYRLGPKYHHPIELGDALRAVRMVTGVGGMGWTQVGVWGFSAGGTPGGFRGDDVGSRGRPGAADARWSGRAAGPDFLVLAYPVITMEEPYVHKGSRDNLLGVPAAAALVEEMSVEKRVTNGDPAYVPVHHDRRRDGSGDEQCDVLQRAGGDKKVPAGAAYCSSMGRMGSGLAPGFPDLKRMAGSGGDVDAGERVYGGSVGPCHPRGVCKVFRTLGLGVDLHVFGG